MQTTIQEATYFMNFEETIVQKFITQNSSAEKTKEERAIQLYYAVRDLIRYDPYTYSFEKSTFKASHVIEAKRAWCVPKSILYTACCRAIGVPANCDQGQVVWIRVAPVCALWGTIHTILNHTNRLHWCTSIFPNFRATKIPKIWGSENSDSYS